MKGEKGHTGNTQALIGQNNEQGKKFVLYIVLVNKEGKAAIDKYFALIQKSNTLEPLDSLDGMEIMSQVNVICV